MPGENIPLSHSEECWEEVAHSIPSLNEGSIIYYDPEKCDRHSPYEHIDKDKLNLALHYLETILSSTSLSIIEVRVLVCLIAYDGMTSKNLMDITGMKQSLVSRAIRSLKERDLIESRSAKTPVAGRPYVIYTLAFKRHLIFEWIKTMEEDIVEEMDLLDREGEGDESVSAKDLKSLLG